MPVAAPIIGAALAATSITAAGGVLFSLSTFAVSLALSFAASALAPKPDKPDFGSFNSIRASGVTQQFSQPVTQRTSIYGEARVSGAVVFPAVTESNKYLHLVIAIAGHELEEIGEVMIDDVSVPPDHMDSDGNVTEGDFAGHLRIKKHLGTADQVADADLVAEVDDWTEDHRLRGVAYIYVRYTWDRNRYAGGIPNLSAWVKGKKVYDTRSATTKWTPNLALCTRDYLVDETYGLAASTSSIDETTLNSGANVCEEYVTTTDINNTVSDVDTTENIITFDADSLVLQTGDKVRLISGTIGGLSTGVDYYVIVYQRKTTPRLKLAASLADCLAGTEISLTSGTSGVIRKIAEPRYFGGGSLKSGSERGNNLRELYTSMAGQVVFAGGVWRISAGEYNSPTISFDENDLISSIKTQTKVSKRDRFNRVQGIYVSPLYDGNPSDYPTVQNSTYQTQDGEIIKKDLDLAFAQRPHTAQRIAKIYLERMRQEIVFTARFNLTAFKVQVGDNIYFSFDRYGWSSKVFEVTDWSLGADDGTPYIEMTCRENASTVYDWNNGEETSVDPAPNTSLPNPFVVSVVAGFSLDSILSGTQDGDNIFNISASWSAPVDQYVLSGGRFEIEYKRTTETVYKSAGVVDGLVTQADISALQPDVLYDIRIFAFNSLGVKSAETVINNFLVGTTVTTNTEDWESQSLTRDGDDWETDTLTTEDFE